MEIILLDSEVEKFINSLDKITRAKTLRSLKLLEKFSYDLRMPHSKKILENIFELRIQGKIKIRLFYIFKNNYMIITHGFIKKTLKIPEKELEITKNKIKNLI